MLSIVLADPDEAYADMLGTFIGVKCRGKAEVSVFTNFSMLLEYLEKTNAVNILIVAPEFNKDINTYNKVGLIFLLCEKQPENESEYILFKYKPAGMLLEEVLSKYAEKDSAVLGHILKGDKKTRIITVHSARGDSGKTLSALALCMQLAKLGSKTLYLNFETVSTFHYYLNERPKQAENMTSLLYYLRQDTCRLPLKLDLVITNDSLLDISYMEPPGCAFELCELAAADVLKLLSHLKALGRFDAVVFDGDAGLNDLLPSLFLQSDVVVHVLSDDTVSEYKQKFLENELQKHPGLQYEVVAGKSVYIINRWKKDKRQGSEKLADTFFKIPVFMDIFLHSGKYTQLNPDSGFIKAFEEPASVIGSKAGITFTVNRGVAI